MLQVGEAAAETGCRGQVRVARLARGQGKQLQKEIQRDIQEIQ